MILCTILRHSLTESCDLTCLVTDPLLMLHSAARCAINMT